MKAVKWFVAVGTPVLVLAVVFMNRPYRRPVSAQELMKYPVYRTQFTGVSRDYDVIVRCRRYQIDDREFWQYDYLLDYRLDDHLDEFAKRGLPAPPRRIHATAEWDPYNWTAIYAEGYRRDRQNGFNGYRYNPYGRRYGPRKVWDPYGADAGMTPYTREEMTFLCGFLYQARIDVMDFFHQDRN